MTRWGERTLVFIGTSCGLGYVPIAPGTAGALPGVAIFLFIALAAPVALQTILIALALLAVSALTVALGSWAEAHWGKKDPGTFVLDEVAGFLFTVLLFRTPNLLLTTVWAFILTRIIDILKLPPARQLEHLPKGWGILADDLCSSLYAAGILHLIAVYFPRLVGATA